MRALPRMSATLFTLSWALASSALAQVPTCGLSGRIVESATLAPLAGASLWVQPATANDMLGSQIASEDGSFVFSGLPCGPVVLHAHMIGFADFSATAALAPDRQHHLLVRLVTQAIVVDPLEVTIRRSDRLEGLGFYARREWAEQYDYGEFLEAPEIERRQLPTVASHLEWSRLNFVYTRECPPTYYVDGRRIQPARGLDWVNTYIKPQEIEGIEIYRSMTVAVPMEFRDYDPQCGAIVIWLKREADGG